MRAGRRIGQIRRLSVVRLYEVKDDRLYISNIDAFDGSPVIDIKPYVEDLDSKEDAGKGWLAGETDIEHLQLHLKGILIDRRCKTFLVVYPA